MSTQTIEQNLGTFRGRIIDEHMSKSELLEVIKFLSEQYKNERSYNLKIENALPIDWQLTLLRSR